MLIKLTLSEIDGVGEVKADHTTGEVLVEYDSKKVGIEKIFDAIREAGYEPLKEDVI
jgi:copper chaperone CopZ